MSALSVTDTASNRRDQIANFAEMLKGAPLKIKLVELIYKGKKQVKTVEHLAHELKKSSKAVLTIASPLATQGLFDKVRERSSGKNLIAYSKIDFVAANKVAILRLAKDHKKLESYATKTNPKSVLKTTITIKLFQPARAQYRSLLDMDQFKAAKAVKAATATKLSDRLPEEQVKKGIASILGEIHTAKDWGGELADIISSKMMVKGKSQTVAFALKGPAKVGPLFPGKMGKNGDQIQRLFRAPVKYHFVQYEGIIDSSVTEQMEQLAKAKAMLGEAVYFGIVDDLDTKKLRVAFPKKFKA
jgi:hypothetical protein